MHVILLDKILRSYCLNDKNLTGASCHTQNSYWVIYAPTGQVLSLGGICLRPSSSNVAEYSSIIELSRDAISHGVLSLEVRLDSKLVVS